MGEVYDVVIIGAGPAGLTAGLYCAQAGLKTLSLERETMGGKVVNTDKIENYPGFGEGISGAELGAQMLVQATQFGLDVELATVEAVETDAGLTYVKTREKNYPARVVIIAGGCRWKKLGVPGEEALVGKGVGYCALCEGAQFKDKTVAVCGGGDSGVTDALYLTKLAHKIVIIESMPECGALSMLLKRAWESEKIEIMCGTAVEAILGSTQVEAVQVIHQETKAQQTVPVGGVLVRIGWEPETEYLNGIVPLDEQGFVCVDAAMATGVSGIFAAGDIRQGSPMQISTAVGDGTTAAISVLRYLRKSATG
jgi:thioredoxin reductase (NADPH)